MILIPVISSVFVQPRNTFHSTLWEFLSLKAQHAHAPADSSMFPHSLLQMIMCGTHLWTRPSHVSAPRDTKRPKQSGWWHFKSLCMVSSTDLFWVLLWKACEKTHHLIDFSERIPSIFFHLLTEAEQKCWFLACPLSTSPWKQLQQNLEAVQVSFQPQEGLGNNKAAVKTHFSD